MFYQCHCCMWCSFLSNLSSLGPELDSETLTVIVLSSFCFVVKIPDCNLQKVQATFDASAATAEMWMWIANVDIWQSGTFTQISDDKPAGGMNAKGCSTSTMTAGGVREEGKVDPKWVYNMSECGGWDGNQKYEDGQTCERTVSKWALKGWMVKQNT